MLLRARSSILVVTLMGLGLACITDDLGGDSQTADAASNTDQTAPDPETDSGSETEGACSIAETTDVEGCAEIIGESFCSEGGVHVDEGSEIDWGNNPPHSGDHFPTWKNWGEHAEAVPRGNWVHNLEHGGVALLYNCPDGCDAELDELRAVIEARPDAPILMTEDTLLDEPRFAVVSWNWVLEFDVPNVDELVCFVDQHFDHAPESVF